MESIFGLPLQIDLRASFSLYNGSDRQSIYDPFRRYYGPLLSIGMIHRQVTHDESFFNGVILPVLLANELFSCIPLTGGAMATQTIVAHLPTGHIYMRAGFNVTRLADSWTEFLRGFT